MISDIRGIIFLMGALIFFLFIIGALALGTVMRPYRWSERIRPVS